MIVYIDESGDLGWTLDRKYRQGGSSRYLTISCLLVPNELKALPKRVVRDLYKKYNIFPSVELKGSNLSQTQKLFFSESVIKLLNSHPTIKVLSITVNKANVLEHIRRDSNKLYNYMIRLCLLNEIKEEAVVSLLPDPRSIKVKSGNSLLDYLKTELWFELNSKTALEMHSVPSDRSDNLKFIDIVTHIVWDRYENNNRICFDKLMPHIKVKNLFF